MIKSLLSILLFSLVSCSIRDTLGTKKTLGVRGERTGGFLNSPVGLEVGEGRIFADNPIVVTENYKLDENYDLNNVLGKKEKIVFISDNQFLEADCKISYGGIDYTVEECLKNYEKKLASPLVNTEKRWAYDANSKEFLQINTLGHSKIVLDKWLDTLSFLYGNVAYDQSQQGLVRAFPTSIPAQMLSSRGFWFPSPHETIISYSSCDVEDNAYYSAAENKLCYGYDSTLPKVRFAQDPTIIYHEMGHALQKIMLNIRNASAGHPLRLDLGLVAYDEAGGIGEGVSDYFSYFVNKRTHFAEWALGRFLDLSRPLTEDDSLHAPGISTAKSERVSYPHYLPYEPNGPHILYEDIHNAGMIISHFLVALTRDIKESCSWSEEHATRFVMSLLIEAYAEMGDLGAKGSDGQPEGFVNLDSINSWDWINMVNPINYRRFAQTLAKKIYLTLSDGKALQNRENSPLDCGGEPYPKDNIEETLDLYGLLLFDSYNLDGNSISNGHNGRHTGTLPETNPIINPFNRKRTDLIKKKYLIFDPSNGAPSAYVFDKQENMKPIVRELTAQGLLTVSPMIGSDIPYNNGDGKISTGEFVGISLNLYNNSNSTMGGIQILGNSWDHVKHQTQVINGQIETRGFPCNNLGDKFPASLSDGAADLTTGEGTQGGCDYTTRFNGKNNQLEPTEELAPICLVQISGESSTYWAQQGRYLEELENFDPEHCLGEDLNECLVRVARGGEQSWIGQIPPQSSWLANLLNPETKKLDFKANHLIYLEVNPRLITPGTAFLCRFRGRFTNCDDCFHDPDARPDSSKELFDDYLDYEYSGAKPFQILNFQFTVID